MSLHQRAQGSSPHACTRDRPESVRYFYAVISTFPKAIQANELLCVAGFYVTANSSRLFFVR